MTGFHVNNNVDHLPQGEAGDGNYLFDGQFYEKSHTFLETVA